MPMHSRILGLAILLSTTTLVHVAVAQTVTDTPSSPRPADDIITPGQVLLHRTEAALSPQTQTSWEDKLKQSLADAQALFKQQSSAQLNQMRDENARLQQQLTAQQLLMAESARARDEATQAKLAASETRFDALAQTTNTKLEGMAQIADTQNKLNQVQLAALAGEFDNKLHYYATEQLAQARRDTDAALQRVARGARIDVLELQKQTADKLAEIRDAANQKAEAMADARAAAVEKKLADALEQKTSPEQAKQLAREQLADAAPEMRALALQTLSDSQDYIKTVAKDAVKDNDPAVQEALQNAAKNVIAKDNRVVFAMRQAMARQIADEAAGKPIEGVDATGTAGSTLADAHGETPAIPLGNALGDDVQIDPASLQITAPQAGASATVPQILASLGGHKTSLLPARSRRDWVDLRKYKVVVHEDGKTLEELMNEVMTRAEPFTGPWKIKWKISDENKDILSTKFSLDTETSFDEFVSYLAQYLVNDRGVKITFSLFDRDRVIVISD
jgi:vacuolar-type H+-ATPase subunit E/Vma4